MAIFFYYGRLSPAQLDRWQAPMQRSIIDQHPVKQTAYRRAIKDHGYKSVFTNSWLVHQRNRSWIKGLGKNPQKSELIHCWQCLLSEATEPWTHGLREPIACIYTSASAMARHGWCVDKAPGQNTHKSECVFRRSPIAVPTKNCVFIQYTMRTGWQSAHLTSSNWMIQMYRLNTFSWFIEPYLKNLIDTDSSYSIN